jgi:hypothetical protein
MTASAVLPVQVGNLVRDCDPRSGGRVKVVTEVTDQKITVRGRHMLTPETKVSRARVHTNPNKKTGYYLVPNKENV